MAAKKTVKSRKIRQTPVVKAAKAELKKTLKVGEVALISQSGAVEVMRPSMNAIVHGPTGAEQHRIETMLRNGDCQGAKMAARKLFATLRAQAKGASNTFGGAMLRMAVDSQVMQLKAAFRASTCKVPKGGLKGMGARRRRR
jgi:hypothetical protein